MGKRFRVLLLAAIVAAVVVPVGFALSIESEREMTPRSTSHVIASPSSTQTMLAEPIQSIDESSTAAVLRSLGDAAKLFLAGTALCGLAAAVRRAI